MREIDQHAPAGTVEEGDVSRGVRTFNGQSYLDGLASDPRELNWMHGAPPAIDKRITLENNRFLGFPQIRWSLSHMRELVPTVNVWRGSGQPASFDHADASAADIDALTLVDFEGRTRRFEDALFDTYTDGIVVLHRGRIVYERYFGALQPELPHACHSVTKSFGGTLAATLVQEGVLDESKKIPHYVRELRERAWGDASLREVMDMLTGLDYTEDYVDERSGVRAYLRACGRRTRFGSHDGPLTLCDYLCTVRKEGEHGVEFSYKSVNAEVMGWVLARVTGCTFGELLQERLWSQLGCEEDAHISADSAGMQRAGGGMCATLRDLARFGELMRLEGNWRGRQLIPASVVHDLRNGGDPGKFPYTGLSGYSYRNMWWVSHNELSAFEARGINGQLLYVAPKAEMVIARFASHPVASGAAHNPITVPQMLAVGRMLGA